MKQDKRISFYVLIHFIKCYKRYITRRVYMLCMTSRVYDLWFVVAALKRKKKTTTIVVVSMMMFVIFFCIKEL